jgi:hypothetical protein
MEQKDQHMIHLKTRPVKGVEQRFAILIEPDTFVPTPKVSPKQNDEELYAHVEAHGFARIHEFEEDNPFHLKRNYTVLNPKEFKEQWMGD